MDQGDKDLYVAISILEDRWDSSNGFTRNSHNESVQSSLTSLMTVHANVNRYASKDADSYDVAFLEFSKLLGSQWKESGMIPSLMYAPTNSTNQFTNTIFQPGASFWGEDTNSSDGRVTSGLAAFPLHGSVAWHLFNSAPNRTFSMNMFKPILTKIKNWHKYLWENRRPERGNGLLYLSHPFESPFPYAAEWNSTEQILPECKDKTYTYPESVTSDPRFNKTWYDSEICRLSCLRDVKYDKEKCGFVVSDVTFSSAFLRSSKDSVKLALALGEVSDANEFDVMSSIMQDALEKTWSAVDLNTGREYHVGRARESVLLADGLSYVPGTQKSNKISLTALTSYLNETIRREKYTELWSHVCTYLKLDFEIVYNNNVIVAMVPMLNWMVAQGFVIGNANSSLYGSFLFNQSFAAMAAAYDSNGFLPFALDASTGNTLGPSQLNDTLAAALAIVVKLPDPTETIGDFTAPFGSTGTIIFIFVLLTAVLCSGCIFVAVAVKFLFDARFVVAKQVQQSPQFVISRPIRRSLRRTSTNDNDMDAAVLESQETKTTNDSLADLLSVCTVCCCCCSLSISLSFFSLYIIHPSLT